MSNLRFVLSRIGSMALTGALLVAAAGPAAAENSSGVSFRVVSWLGGPAPGGGHFLNDFEVGGLNDRGDALFVSDLTSSPFTEGLYVGSAHGAITIARGGQPAPGGGTLYWVNGKTSINASGQITAPFGLTPDLSLPVGMNEGLFIAQPGSALRVVLAPGATPAPGGGTFQGTLNSDINNGGDIVFDAITPTTSGIHLPGETYLGLGKGVFLAAANGGPISVVAQPGDPAPGGGMFDFASTPTINGAGDIAFRAHVVGHPCVTFDPQSVSINCYDSLYVRRTATGKVERIAGIGDAAPGGGTFSSIRGPLINDSSQITFAATITPVPTVDSPEGLFLASPGGQTVAVVRPGDSMPGGGTVQSVRGVGCVAINNKGDVTFEAQLTDGATGLYVWSRGAVRLVAHTGTIVAGFGTLASPASFCDTARAMNNLDEILFTGTFADGRTALMVAKTL